MARRFCSICGRPMADGYCYSGGAAYYCSAECLHHDFTDEQWRELCEEDDDCYWTEWYDESLWKVNAVAVSGNAVTQCAGYFESFREAKNFCDLHDWNLYIPDDGGSTWELRIELPYDDRKED